MTTTRDAAIDPATVTPASESRSARARWLPVVLLALLPLVVMGPCLVSGRSYLPYDLGEYPPASLQVSAEAAALRNEGANKDATEPPVWFEPEYRLAREALAAGRWPQWNPYARLGSPVFAHGHMGFADPLHWPALATSSVAGGFWILTTMMFGLGGLLTFGLLRSLGVDRRAALFGGAAAALSGTLAANGPWFMRMEPLVLLPGLLWAALATARRRGWARVPPAAAMAAGVGLCWSCGFPPYALPVTTVLAAWCAALVVRALARREGRSAWALAGVLWVAGGLGLVLALVQLLPQLEFLPWSNRPTEPDPDYLAGLCFDPIGLLGWLLAEPFGHPTDATLPYESSPFAQAWFGRQGWTDGGPLRSNYNFTEYALFPGTLPMLLAVVALILGRGRRWLWLGALGVAWMLSVAAGSPWTRGLFGLPGFDSAPPMRFAGPTYLAMAVAAGLGWAGVMAAARAGRRGALWIGAAVAGGVALGLGMGWWSLSGMNGAEDPMGLAAALARRFEPLFPGLNADYVRSVYLTGADGQDFLARGYVRLTDELGKGALRWLGATAWIAALGLWGRHAGPRKALALVGAAATLLELGLGAQALNRGIEPTPIGATPAHEFLRAQRATADAAGGFAVLRIGEPPQVPVDLPAGTLVRDRIRDLQVYTFVDGRSSPLLAERFGAGVLSAKDANLLTFPPRVAAAPEPVLDALGVRFVFGSHRTIQPDVRASLPEPVHVTTAADGERWFAIWERPSSLPRAWAVPRIRSVPTPVRALTRDGWKPERVAIVDAEDLAGAGLAAPTSTGASGAPFERSVAFAVDEPERVVLDVGDGPAGYVVLADAALPGWSVTLDGAPVSWCRANHCMRLVPVPAGACRLEWTYATPGLSLGLTLSLGGWGLLLGLVAMAAWRRRRQVPSASANDGAMALAQRS